MNKDSAIVVSTHDLNAFADELGQVPHLSEKMLVDLVNGAGDFRDLLETKKNEGFVRRFFGALDGSNRRREIIIQGQTQNSIEVLTSWALDLTNSISFTQESLKKVADKLLKTRDDLMKVARAVCVNSAELENLGKSLRALDYRLSKRIEEAERRLLTVEDKQLITEVTEAWLSGRHYEGYPAPVQVTFVVDDLMRGERGRRIFQNPSTREFMYDRIVNVCVQKKTRQDCKKSRSFTRHWLPKLAHTDPVKCEVMSYGLRMPSHCYLHNAMAQYSESKSEPIWLKEHQENGLVPEYMDVKDFAYELVRENITSAPE